MSTPLIEPVARLIEAFARLPGIGPKTAQRLTYHLLRAPDAEARSLAAALVAVRDEVVFCDDRASTSATRRPARSAATRAAIRAACASSRSRSTSWPSSAPGEWRGRYHVLHGAISPMDGIGPERLRIRELLERVVDRRARRRAGRAR